MRARDLGRAFLTYAWTGVASSVAIGAQLAHEDPERLARHTLRWARVLERLWGLEIHVEGLEHYRRGERLVLVANHQSYVDIVALFLSLPEMPVFLAKRELARVPVFSRVMRARGDVFIDRRHHESATSTIDRTAELLRPGAPLLVFPEGTRAHRPEVGPFKKGAFHLAKRAHAALQPIGIRGSLEAWPRDLLAPRGGAVHVALGPAMSAEVVRASDIDELLVRARVEVSRLSGLPLAEDAPRGANGT